ncbi:hypothetical protein [Phenylobacterium sp.]
MSDHQIGMLSVTAFIVIAVLGTFVALRTGYVKVRLELPPVAETHR